MRLRRFASEVSALRSAGPLRSQLPEAGAGGGGAARLDRASDASADAHGSHQSPGSQGSADQHPREDPRGEAQGHVRDPRSPRRRRHPDRGRIMTAPICVFDISAYLHRAMYVCYGDRVADTEPENTAFIRHACGMLANTMDTLGAQRVVVVCDSTEPSFRCDEYPAYKAERKEHYPVFK